MVQIVVRNPIEKVSTGKCCAALAGQKVPMIVAQPIGHSVPFSNEVQTSWLLFVFGVLIDPTFHSLEHMRNAEC